MENLVFTQLSVPEVRQMLRQELADFFSTHPTQNNPEVTEELLTIQQAAQLLHLSVPTIYGLVSHSRIPHMKPGKRLYFSKDQLTEWVKSTRRKTIIESGMDADTFLAGKKKRG